MQLDNQIGILRARRHGGEPVLMVNVDVLRVSREGTLELRGGIQGATAVRLKDLATGEVTSIPLPAREVSLPRGLAEGRYELEVCGGKRADRGLKVSFEVGPQSAGRTLREVGESWARFGADSAGEGQALPKASAPVLPEGPEVRAGALWVSRGGGLSSAVSSGPQFRDVASEYTHLVVESLDAFGEPSSVQVEPIAASGRWPGAINCLGPGGSHLRVTFVNVDQGFARGAEADLRRNPSAGFVPWGQVGTPFGPVEPQHYLGLVRNLERERDDFQLA